MPSSRSTDRKPPSWTAAQLPLSRPSTWLDFETLDQPRRYLKVLKPVRVALGDAYGELRPNAHGFRIEAEVHFDHALIGRQALIIDVKPDTFRREIARARTFGFMRDVTSLWSSGYALGASLENTLVVSDKRILNPEGARFPDEFVRHKVLDAIGDLALAGAPLLATYRSVRGGHKLNHAVLCALMADPSAWTWVNGQITTAHSRPCRNFRAYGAGIRAGDRLSSSRVCPPHSGRNVRLFPYLRRGFIGYTANNAAAEPR